MCKLLISKFLINGFKLVLNFFSTSWSFANFTGVAGGAVRPVEKQPNRRLSEGWWGLQNDFANRWNRELGLFWGRNKVVNSCLGGPHLRSDKARKWQTVPCLDDALEMPRHSQKNMNKGSIWLNCYQNQHWHWIAWIHLDIRTMI